MKLEFAVSTVNFFFLFHRVLVNAPSIDSGFTEHRDKENEKEIKIIKRRWREELKQDESYHLTT